MGIASDVPVSFYHGLPLSVTDVEGNTAYMAYDSYGDVTSRNRSPEPG